MKKERKTLRQIQHDAMKADIETKLATRQWQKKLLEEHKESYRNYID